MLRDDPKPCTANGLVPRSDDGTSQQSLAGDIEQADVQTCLTEIGALIRAAWKSGIHVEIRLGPGLPLVACSRDDLQNAILNLLLNAHDAIPNGGQISIDAMGIADRWGRFVELRIRDNGIGMTRDTLLRAFDPFFTTKDTGLGGFGLSIVKQFAEQSGGSVNIDSALGVGTTVLLRLPASSLGTSRAS